MPYVFLIAFTISDTVSIYPRNQATGYKAKVFGRSDITIDLFFFFFLPGKPFFIMPMRS